MKRPADSNLFFRRSGQIKYSFKGSNQRHSACYPSQLQEICTEVSTEMQKVIGSYTLLSEKSAARKSRQTGTLLYLLSVAFGPPYLWSCLEKTFKKEPLAKNLFYKNSAARMTQLGKMLPDSIFYLQQEAIDYLAVNRFLDFYTEKLTNNTGGDVSMKTVNELIKGTWETPVEEIQFKYG